MKISVVTPAFNMEAYIAQTIESVISQKGDFDLEYIVVIDGSSDGTEGIVRSYADRLANGSIKPGARSFSLRYLSSEENRGMYTAINSGFSLATGDIFTWIGADDIYRPDTALGEIASWFANHPKSSWAKGICGFIDQTGRVIREGVYKTYYQDWLQKGIYGRETYFVEQESTFWRASLWHKVAPIPPQLRSAGDYWLGIEFAKHAPLDSIRAQTTYFRIRPGQISSHNAKYRNEQEIIMPKRSITAYKMRLYSILTNRFGALSFLWRILYKLMFPTRSLPPRNI